MEAARAVPPLPVSDRELLARAGRSPEAFAELYRRHYGTIGTYLLRRTGDRAATEDLLGEVFLAALRGVRRFRWRAARSGGAGVHPLEHAPHLREEEGGSSAPYTPSLPLNPDHLDRSPSIW